MTYDYDSTDPKMARGLVKDELRPLKASRKIPVHQNLLKFMSGLRDKHMPPTDKFSTTVAGRLRKAMLKEAGKVLKPVSTFKSKILIDEDDAKLSEVEGFLYWLSNPMAVSYSGPAPHHDFESDFLELRAMRVSTNRRRLVLDDSFCHLMISEHLLVRLLERGFAHREPLQAFTDELKTILPLTAMFSLGFIAGKVGKYPHVLFPFRDGVILCKVSFLAADTAAEGRHFRFRAISDATVTKSTDLPFDSLFEDTTSQGKGNICIYAATYIPRYRLSTEQIWAKMQIEQLLEDERDFLEDYAKLTYISESVILNLPERFNPLFEKVDKITKNQRWQVATSATLMQGS